MKSALPGVVLVWVCAAFPAAWSQQAPLITNISARQTISLNGSWHIIVDPYETGLGERYYEDRKPKDKSDRVEYDFDRAETLSVPGDWNTQKEKLLFYEGPLWYRKTFGYQNRERTRLYLYFGAANYSARVYLNGQKLGEHEGGFTPFNFEITNFVHEGANSLVVEVNNMRRADAVPALRTDWWNYGGLTRDVLLVAVPETFFEDYFIQLAKSSQSEIAGWVQLHGNSKAGQRVTITIPEAGAKQSLTTDASGHAEFRFPAKLTLWSPEEPKLYDVSISTPDDTVRDTIGFRSIEVKGTQVLLNGKPVFLRGIAVHEEAPFRSGRAFSPEDAATLFGWAKDLGCNFVRLAHYPHNENEIRAADRMGLLLWSEIPVYWDIAWDSPATLASAEAQLRDMIARDKNRAAVVFWSLSNETPIKPERTEFLKKLADQARQLDSTRLLTSAMDRVDTTAPELRTLSDPLGQYLDVLGLNEYLGWYWGKPEDADHMQWKFAYNKPLIISEFGGDAPYGNHGDADTRWTEEYQASLFEHQIAMQRKIPSMVGMSPWILMDFRTPRRPLVGIQDYFNRKGLISNRGEKKEAFWVLQKYYQSEVGRELPGTR
jgi:beta-glucuronidase